VENLKSLEPIGKMIKKKYREGLYRRKAAEGMMQELIEAAIDINLHLISAAGHSTPDDYSQSFITAGELKIISPDLGKKLAPSAGS
jgi:uncharacterized protein YutE (UPF0331/DUF86 family)